MNEPAPKTDEESETSAGEDSNEIHEELDEVVEQEISEALSCPCVSDLKEGPCGGDFVNSFSCFLRNNRDGKELENCVEAFHQLQECMVQHPEQFADFVEAKPTQEAATPVKK